MNSQISIPASAGGVSSDSMPIPPGTRCIRVEVILSEADFAAGKIVSGIGTISVGPYSNSFEWTNTSGPLGNGDAMTGGVLAEDPFLDVATAHGKLVCTNDETCMVGAVISFADFAINMPATQRASIQ